MKRMNVYYKMAKGTRDAFLKDLMDNKISECAMNVKGCLQYQYFVPVDDPDLLLLIERWESEEAISVQKAAPHFKKVQELKGDRVIGWEMVEY